MVEVVAFRHVFAADVEHRDGWIGEIGFGGLAAKDRRGVLREENGAVEELVLMGAAGMG